MKKVLLIVCCFSFIGCNEQTLEKEPSPKISDQGIKQSIEIDALKKYCIWQAKKNRGDNLSEINMVKETASFIAFDFKMNHEAFHATCTSNGNHASRKYSDIRI